MRTYWKDLSFRIRESSPKGVIWANSCGMSRGYPVCQTFLCTIPDSLNLTHLLFQLPQRWPALGRLWPTSCSRNLNCFTSTLEVSQLLHQGFPTDPSELTLWLHMCNLKCGGFNSPWDETLTSEKGRIMEKAFLPLQPNWLSWEELASLSAV